MKGFLTWHDRVFRKTHDLVELGGRCVQVDPGLEPVLRRAAPLTEYAGGIAILGNRSRPPRPRSAMPSSGLARP